MQLLFQGIRGGVEDPTFEAKAKDSKNPRPSPSTDFLRTSPLEDKDRNVRDQGQRILS